jgi:hypothetical protein
MTSQRRRHTERHARDAVAATRNAAREAVRTDPSGVELDPASALFFEFAAPLLLTAGNEQEFRTASELAEFIWASTHFSAATQVALLNDFIQETKVPDAMIPWLLDVYAELAARKLALVGE